MEFFARDMQDVVRTLFPDEQNKRRHTRTHSSNKKKRKRRRRSSVSTALSTPTPHREVRNVATKNSSTSSNGNSMVTQILLQDSPYLITNRNLFSEGTRGSEPAAEASYGNIEKGTTVANPGANNFLRLFHRVISTQYPPDTEYLLIRDVVLSDEDEENMNVDTDDDDDDDDMENEEIPFESLTTEQINNLRVLMMPPQRQATMDQMGRLLLGDDEFDRVQNRLNHHITYGPSFWYHTLQSARAFKKTYADTRDLPERFDMLFGFTWHLAKHPRWMTQHARGWKGEQMVASLAVRWKNLLKYDPRQLGIYDEEFSFPALLWFLDDFKATVEGTEMYGDPKMRFEYL